MALTTRFTQRLGVRHPIACATFGFVTDTLDLPVAVAAGGGLAAIGVPLMPAEGIKSMIQGFRARASEAPLNVGFLTCFVDDDHIEAVANAPIAVVTFHWGLPKPDWVMQLQGSGAQVWCQVGSVNDALAAIKLGADGLIAQGFEAGGHNYGGLPVFVLVPEIRRAVGTDPLLLAAGGIGSGATLAASLALGADAAWIGTRFVATPEAHAHANYKQRIVDASGDQTELTDMFGREMPDFNPMRVLRNKAVQEWHHRQSEMIPVADEPVIGEMSLGGQKIPIRQFANLPPMPDSTASLDAQPLLAGQGVGLVERQHPAAEVIAAIVSEAEEILHKLANAG